MRNQFNFKAIALLTMVVSLFSLESCTKESGHDDDQVTKTYTLTRKTNYGNDWIYFNFEKGDTVKVNEATHADDLSWDIAFNRANIRTNSGASGKGQGGALLTDAKDYNSLLEVPAGEFTVDVEAEIMEKLVFPMPIFCKSTLNELLGRAVSVDTSNPPPVYTIPGYVYVVRTANGKYVKFMVESYHKAGASGFITFRYTYQPDGTTVFPTEK